MFVGSAECMTDREQDQKGKPKVKQFRSVRWTKGGEADDWFSLGVGDSIIDSAADESCWPEGQGDVLPTEPSNKRLRLRTANVGDMEHYGQKEVFFKSGGGGDPFGLLFQVTDVRMPGVLGLEFGENVLWKYHRGRRTAEINATWGHGVYLGVREKSES